MSQKAKWDTTDSVSWSRFNSFTGTLACYSEFSRGIEPTRCMCLGDAPQELTQECVEGGSPRTSLLLAEDWIQFNPAQAQRPQTKEFQHPNQKRIGIPSPVGRRTSVNLELLAPSQPSVSTTPVKAYHLQITRSSANLSPKHAHRHTQKWCFARYLGNTWLSHVAIQN